MNIVEPGLYDGIPDDEYHAGTNTPTRSLSQSALKNLIPPSTPAHFWHQLHTPQPPRRVFDIGRAAHMLVLGVGEPVAACPTEYLSVNGQMTTTKAKAWAYTQREQGVTPLSPVDYQMVHGMIDALLGHHRVLDILTDPHKRPEVSAYAIDPDAGVWLRGRFDLAANQLWDYKTSASADPDQFRRSAWSYGYHVQDATYRLIYELLVGVDPGPMRFIVQEKTPPYLVSTVVLDGYFEAAGRQQLRAALDLYVDCMATESWPGYPDELVTISPPPYALRDVDIDVAAEPVPLDPALLASLDQLANKEGTPS